jgi:hypothetical protein
MKLKNIDFKLIVIFSYLLVFICSLTFVYIEGDDAASVIFHALGRNSHIQPPYASYQGMIDLVFRILPANEPILRVTFMTVSAVFSVLFEILMLVLCFEWLGIEKKETKNVLAIFGLLAFPEFFFLSLVYTPTMVGMSFILLSHLLIRKGFINKIAGTISANQLWKAVIISGLLFGFGASCRWNLVLYGVIVAVDILVMLYKVYQSKQKFPVGELSNFVIWGALSLIFTFIFIGLSGYSVTNVYREIFFSKTFLKEKPSILPLLRMTPFLTPAALLAMLFGIFRIVKQKRNSLLIIVSFLVALPLIKQGVPKMIIVSIPGFVLLTFEGVLQIMEYYQNKKKLWGYLLIAAVVLPWIVGIKIYTDKPWGPGFKNNVAMSPYKGKTKILPALKGGAAFPTPEGVRPMYGYAFVLLGGEWRNYQKTSDNIRDSFIGESINSKTAIFQDAGNDMLFVNLLKKGYTTKDPLNSGNTIFKIRRFTNEKGDSVNIFTLRKKTDLYMKSSFDTLRKSYTKPSVYLFSGYPSTLEDLRKNYPGSVTFEKSGVVDIDINKFRNDLDENKGKINSK